MKQTKYLKRQLIDGLVWLIRHENRKGHVKVYQDHVAFNRNSKVVSDEIINSTITQLKRDFNY